MLENVEAPKHALYPIGDDIGFVSLIESMGNDTNIVNAARTSFGKRSNLLSLDRDYFTEEILKDAWDKDFKLIKYLLKHKHETPLESTCLVFLIKTPIFIARQHFRHRISSFNEISGRYVEVKDEFYIPKHFRKQSTNNRQASIDDYLEWDEVFHNGKRETLIEAYECTYKMYQALLKKGVCREQARGVLPLATYTQYQWTCNLRSFLHFIELRDHSGAQWEIQQYAKAMLKLVKPIFPCTIQAWEELRERK